MTLDQKYQKKLQTLANRIKQPISKIEAEFNEAYNRIVADETITVSDDRKQKKSYHIVLTKYQAILRSTKFIGITWSKDSYFDQTRWLRQLSESIAKKQGKDLARLNKWLNEKDEFCDGRQHLDKAKTMTNPNYGKPIRDHLGNRTIRLMGYYTDDQSGKPKGSLIEFRLVLNGRRGVDSAVSNKAFPMNKWMTFYANVKDNQKNQAVFTGISFPPNTIVEILTDEEKEGYGLKTEYEAIREFFSVEMRRKAAVDVSGINAAALVKQNNKDYEPILTEVDIHRIPPTAGTFYSIMTVDSGIELTDDISVVPEDMGVRLPSYIFELVDYGPGSTALLIGVPYRAQKKDKQGNVIEGEYENAVFNATNIIGVPGEIVKVHTEEISKEKLDKMESTETSEALETLSPGSDLAKW